MPTKFQLCLLFRRERERERERERKKEREKKKRERESFKPTKRLKAYTETDVNPAAVCNFVTRDGVRSSTPSRVLHSVLRYSQPAINDKNESKFFNYTVTR